MKFCKNCGNQLEDTMSFCTNCGTACEQAAPQQTTVTEQQPAPQQPQVAPQQPQYAAPQQQAYCQPEAEVSGLAIAAKVLMIISTVVMGLYLIPLAWCLPMTISYSKKLKRGEPISTGFKVCTLLFVNTIGGILMLCDKSR